MLKSLLKGFLVKFKGLIARCWILPLDTLLWELVGVDQSSPWHRLRTVAVWLRDLGRLIYAGFRANVSRWDGSEWSVIYISDGSYDSEKELQHLLFQKPPVETELNRVFIWRLPALIQQFASQGCLMICDVNRLLKWQFQGMYCIRCLPWQRALLDVSAPVDTIVSRFRKLRKRELAKAHKLGLEYCVSHDLADWALFYHEMYVPFINERYRDRAIIHSFEGLQETFEKRGELMYLKYQNSPVVAYFGTRRRYDRTFSALLMGVHQDYTHLVNQGLITALYWHVINWAHSHQLSVVDFGRVRARLNDGLFAFKRQFGMWFERDILTHTMWTFIGKDLPLNLVRRLNELALIAEAGKEYRCVAFAEGEASLPDKELAQREEIATQAGLDGLLLLPPPGREHAPAIRYQ